MSEEIMIHMDVSIDDVLSLLLNQFVMIPTKSPHDEVYFFELLGVPTSLYAAAWEDDFGMPFSTLPTVLSFLRDKSRPLQPHGEERMHRIRIAQVVAVRIARALQTYTLVSDNMAEFIAEYRP